MHSNAIFLAQEGVPPQLEAQGAWYYVTGKELESKCWFDASVILVGKFEGVHRGHQLLLAKAKEKAQLCNAPLVVLTFSPLPEYFFAKQKSTASPKEACLTTESQKVRLLTQSGADAVFVVHFNEELALMEAEDFVEQILLKALGCKVLLSGSNFKLGKHQAGDTNFLRKKSLERGFSFEEISLQTIQTRVLSSSKLRQALEDGQISFVNTALGRPYQVQAVVQQGRQLGRELGYPTINLDVSVYAPMKYGIYATRVWLESTQKWIWGAANFGVRPTVEKEGVSALLEVYLLDFDGDLYGQRAWVDVLDFIRPEATFSNLETLIQAIEKDVLTLRSRIASYQESINSCSWEEG